MQTKNIMIVGVGGQGTLLASKLLGKMLLQKGFDVKVSEVHGMSQRGGSVVTYIRYGEKVYSPVVDIGEADFIISFEQQEFFLEQNVHLSILPMVFQFLDSCTYFEYIKTVIYNFL